VLDPLSGTQDDLGEAGAQGPVVIDAGKAEVSKRQAGESLLRLGDGSVSSGYGLKELGKGGSVHGRTLPDDLRRDN
jgi:hypothetical protein